jgi:5-methylcytosine-specific restriction endonuclease McrA
MSGVGPKKPRIKLDPDVYEKLHQRVLERDNWRCQNCGCLQNLEVHHKSLRSHQGDDSELNLITLCDSCHSNEHR